MAAQKLPPTRALARSRSANAGNEESVYALGNEPVVGAAPKIRTYHVPVPDNSKPQPTGGANSGNTPGLPPTPKQRMHADSSQIESILNPVRGPRDAQVRAGIKPVNHARANVLAVKEQSQMNNLRKISDHSSQQYTKLPPVRSTSAPTRRPIQRMPSDSGRDFLMENKLGAAAPMRPPRPDRRDDDGAKYLAKKDYGRVPQYLVDRKMEMLAEQDAKERAKEAALIPPGMRLLPEEERLETLAILQKNKDEVERAIQGLPLRIETPSAIRRKDELERRLKEIEDAFKIFSRPKVIVHI